MVRMLKSHNQMRLQTIFPLALVSFAAASLLAQPAPPSQQQGIGPGQRMGPRQAQGQGQQPQQRAQAGPNEGQPATRIQRMAQALRLTPDQQQKARQLFRAESNSMTQAHRQARNAHEALQDSVRTGASDAEVDRLAQAAGAAQGQVEAIHVKTMTKFYAMLSQDQKDLFDEHGGRIMGGPGGRRGGGGPGPGMRGGPDGPGMPGPGGPQ